MNPGPAPSVFPGIGECRTEGLGSDEETGIGRGPAGPDRPRLHARGARAGPFRGGRTPGAWSLVPDGNRGVSSPEVAAAVCADVAAKLSPVAVVLVKSA